MAKTAKPKVVHHCHAVGCETEVLPRLLMCLKHWKMVPKALQNRVWEHYVVGQEVKKNPTREYIEAAKEAIKAVAEKEGNLHLFNQKFRKEDD